MNSESNNQRKLKNKLIKELPFFPNDIETLNELEQKPLSLIIRYYLHWQTRQVPKMRRKVRIYPELTSDNRYKHYKLAISEFLEKVRNGDDLSPYLSRKAHKNGYTSTKRNSEGRVDKWEDKDQILNKNSFHHFHLNMNVQRTGLSIRTDVVLFAKVTRGEFHAVTLFDHSVFDNINDEGEMTLEHNRMLDIYTKYKSYDVEQCSIYISNPLMSSGHPVSIVRMSHQYMYFIRKFDDQLSDRALASDFYSKTNMHFPNKFKFNWHIEYLDLIIRDVKNNVDFVVFKGSS